MISAVVLARPRSELIDDGGARTRVPASAAARSRGLLQAPGGQRGVEPALPPLLDVPFRLAVADDQDVVHGWSVKQTGRADPLGLTLDRPGTKLDRPV